MSRRAAVNVAIGAVYVAILVAVFLSIRPFARWYETTPPAEANAIVIMAFAAGIVMLIAVAMVLWARHKWLFARDEDTDEYLRPLRHGSVAAERQMLAFFRPRGWVHKPQTAARQMMARLDAARPRRRLAVPAWARRVWHDIHWLRMPSRPVKVPGRHAAAGLAGSGIGDASPASPVTEFLAAPPVLQDTPPLPEPVADFWHLPAPPTGSVLAGFTCGAEPQPLYSDDNTTWRDLKELAGILP